ncbi:hypothetical protein LSM04_009247 [Trypanosoma melophagium]|uniref:uncharacterized protein n=1 Tax=Trypanosoma melophagium TaxID=715481 RepID=UPI00351A81A8|nr:hypothetical protein LSM04_009247 [Trypanosoma melophagium]
MLLTHVSAHRGGSDAPFVNGPDLSYSSAARRPKTDRACTRATAHRGIGAKTQSFLSREYLRQRNPLCRAVGREREPASAGAPQGVRRREKPTATAIREQAEAPRISLRSYILALSLRRRLRLKALRSDIPRKRRQNHRLQAHNSTASGSPAPIPTSILWNGVRDASFDVDTFKGAWGFQAQGQGTPWRWCIARLSEKAPRGSHLCAFPWGPSRVSCRGLRLRLCANTVVPIGAGSPKPVHLLRGHLWIRQQWICTPCSGQRPGLIQKRGMHPSTALTMTYVAFARRGAGKKLVGCLPSAPVCGKRW